MDKLKSWMACPPTKGLDLDDPSTTQLRRQIIRRKSFLRQIYREWYRVLVEALPVGQGLTLELGSGAGFLDEMLPGVITTELFYCPGIRAVLDAQRLPWANESLRAIVMVNVLHHIPRPHDFFAEATRCVRAEGAIIMIEPWVTRWSRWVYAHLHHEPFHPDAREWEFRSTGPLSGANGALAWMIFGRDKGKFESMFPAWQIERVELMLPFAYLLSGGVSLRRLMPGWTFGFWRRIERRLDPWSEALAMFAHIVLRKK